MYKYIEFYENKSPEKKEGFHRGLFYWTCFPYVFSSPRVTRFWNNRPTETLDINRFDPSKEKYDSSSKTEVDEFLAITRYKRRPVLLLSSPSQKYSSTGLRGGEYFLVAPLRSLRIKETSEYKFPPSLVWNTILYNYNSLFYIPESNSKCINESFVLFERTTSLHYSWLSPCDSIQLTSDAMSCLDMWFRNFIYGSVPAWFTKEVEAYRSVMGENPKIKNDVFGMDNYLKKPKN